MNINVLFYLKSLQTAYDESKSHISARWYANMADFGQKPLFFFLPRPTAKMDKVTAKTNFTHVGGYLESPKLDF